MPSQEYEEFLKKVKHIIPIPNLSAEEGRHNFEKMMSGFDPPDNILCHPHRIKDVPVEWVMPAKPLQNRVILFLHGGGFNAGSVRSHSGLMGILAEKTKTRILGIDYRLAPENPFPSALEDALNCYHWLILSGYHPSQITVAGNSAGGGLVLSLILALKNAHEPLPHAGVCISPWLDLTLSSHSLKENAKKDFLRLERLKIYAEWYLGKNEATNPLISPIFADLKGFPPLLVHVGSHEILLDDARKIAKRAEEYKVDLTLEIWEEMVHSWHLFAPKIPEGAQAIGKIAEWITTTYHQRNQLAAKK